MTNLDFLASFRSFPIDISYGVTPVNHVRVGNSDELKKVLESAQKNDHNTWFRFNPSNPGTGAGGAVTDADVSGFVGIPIDIDLPDEFKKFDDDEKDAGVKSIESWKEETVQKLLSGAVIPRASAVWTSGNGIQAILRFPAVISVADLSAEKYSALVKGISERLIAAGMNADTKIHNPSRLMRIPDGRNFKSRVFGQYPEARPLHHGDEAYGIESLTPLESVVAAKKGPARKSPHYPIDAFVPATVRGILEDGPEGIKDLSDEFRKFKDGWSTAPDESNLVMLIVAMLYAGGNSNRAVDEILLTEGTWVKRHWVEEKGLSLPDQRRQIKRKLDCVVAYYPHLYSLGQIGRERAYFPDLGGKPSGYWRHGQAWSPMASLEDFYKSATQKDAIQELKAWVQSPYCRHYKSLANLRVGKTPFDSLNICPGFQYLPVKGDWGLLQEHIRRNICGDREDCYEYLMNWMAKGLQVDGPMGSAIVLQGDEGVGKNVFVEQYRALFAPSTWMEITNKNQIETFNGQMENASVVFYNEAFFSEDRGAFEKIKGQITDSLLSIRHMYRATYGILNNTRIIFASNSEHVVRMGANDRRYFCLRVGDGRMRDSKFFGELIDQMKSGGYEAMMYDLLGRDISKFDAGKIPSSELDVDQKSETLISRLERERAGPLTLKIMEWLDDGMMPGGAVHGDDELEVTAESIESWMEGHKKPVTRTTITRTLKSLLDGRGGVRKDKDGKSYRFMTLPSLKKCRERVMRKLGQEAVEELYGWRESDDCWQDWSDADAWRGL